MLKINIVGGTGIMGKIHSRVLREQGHEVTLTGRNSTPSPIEAAKVSDITIISVPLAVTEETIKKVAPFCKAITDFSSVKLKPLEWMKKYSPEDCEIVGLHPLYGETESIKEKTMVVCKTERTRSICNELIASFSKAGAEMFELTPEKHDLVVNGLAQNSRTILLETFGELLQKHNVNINELYHLSPPPTRILLDLLARQVNPPNDEMYSSMKKLNPFQDSIKAELREALENKTEISSPEKIREFFGDELKNAQERAKKIVNSS